jgi:hypothetical protein
MANPRAFVSFDYDNDYTSKVLFAGQADSKSPTPFTVSDWSSKTVLPEAEWEELIEAKIKNVNMLIVLVGTHMSTATGVNKEIQFAINANVPIFGVYVNSGDSTSSLPTGLARSRTVTWTWPNVSAMIDKVMDESKNKSLNASIRPSFWG